MKKYTKELALLAVQLFMFYIFPLFAGPTDAMGMVFLILAATLLLSALMGLLSAKRIKSLYPLIIAALFVPSVWIHYNESALIHALWYLVVAFVGMGFGSLVRLIAIEE